MQKELRMEDKLIHQLTQGKSQWKLREDLKTEEDLWDNFFKILSNNNKKFLADHPLTDNEKKVIRTKVTRPTFYSAAKAIAGANGQYHINLQRDDTRLGTAYLLIINHNEKAGGTSVYEVVHQVHERRRDSADQNRRFDVTLLINGLPVIHIELKSPTAKNGIYQAFNQIQKYIDERKFSGIFSNIQMFVITNGVDTKYIAASEHLKSKFLSGWLDKENNPVHDYLAFARDVLSIPMAHNLISAYSVRDSTQKSIILLRPYQIHAIEAIFKAESKGQSGFIWHTTGSGKTLTSYRVAHNLLRKSSLDKVIFLIDRKDLDNQTTQAFQSYANSDSIEVKETDSTYNLMKKLISSDRNVIVTTRQKLQNLMRKSEENPSPAQQKKFAKLKNLYLGFIVDECHRTVTSPTKIEIDKFFNRLPLWYGFTGTPITAENPRDEDGKAARTTEDQYGPCLHTYTIKDAIRDHAVLSFKVNDFGNTYQSDDLEEDTKKADKMYVSDQHMHAVAEAIIHYCYRSLGINTINNSQRGRGYTYSALFTVKPSAIRPTVQAQKYYKLFKDIKDGKSDIKVPSQIKKVLPDFPKIAITFSISQNEEYSEKDQDFMKMVIDDYNHEYGTSFDLEQLSAYNKDVNNRLARKLGKYKSQDERLDLVIVVDRLLTGFDSKYLSTLFVDRPPMLPQNIIQYFSRTNRIFDDDKKTGNIFTFQYPEKFSEAIDEAVRIYSNDDSDNKFLAPRWDKIKNKFDQAYKPIAQIQKAGEDSILDAPEEDQKEFLKQFRAFDKALAAAQTYEDFEDQIDGSDSYKLDSESLDKLKGAYEDLYKKFKKDGSDPVKVNEEDLEYHLESFSKKTIDYKYILQLIQAYLPDNEEDSITDHNVQEINQYISELEKTNPTLASMLENLWQNIQQTPNKYIGKQVDQLLEEMQDQAYDQEIAKFADEYCLDINVLKAVITNFDEDKEIQPSEQNLLTDQAFRAYKEKTGDNNLIPLLWNSKVRKELRRFYKEKIAPLVDE